MLTGTEWPHQQLYQHQIAQSSYYRRAPLIFINIQHKIKINNYIHVFLDIFKNTRTCHLMTGSLFSSTGHLIAGPLHYYFFRCFKPDKYPSFSLLALTTHSNPQKRKRGRQREIEGDFLRRKKKLRTGHLMAG